MRRETRRVMVGAVPVGGGAPVTVQSMLNVPAADVAGNVAQARRLEEAGCEILRVSVPAMSNVNLIGAIKEAISIPLVADIHFDYRIALAAAEAGVDKIRLNPGNIGEDKRVRAVAEICQKHNVPIRIGVNGGSLEKEILRKYGAVCADALVESALYHVKILEELDFMDIVISIKSSNVVMNVAAYRKLATLCNYPLHLGVTEAGTYDAGVVKNAVGIGTLLLDGIGDTIRVSLTDEPEKEVLAGKNILRAAGHPVRGPQVISCPTCGRTNIPVAAIANEVENRLQGRSEQFTVAVMGCVVNGIGEGKEADIGLAGGVDSAVLFVKGKQVRTVRGSYIEELMYEIDKMCTCGII
ncbi:flavodoxin-dependent (E)-4-hydroxy-3-methylbut-2-enyl-diphosphate synthase [Ruminococcaceae bacterium OttesenSCG-928-O06]|nr:flavodoxin-dependent (E)-4-hydroxy-3-methylbut-2-enyl-diphosphate synthase [Ruminococcaceae bacterium OttesenSCG-928-O06]